MNFCKNLFERLSKVLILVIITVFISNLVFASGVVEVSMPNTISVYTEPVNVDVSLYNPSNEVKLYYLKPHMAPFTVILSQTSIRVNPKTRTNVELMIYPQLDQLESSYNSNLEIKTLNSRKLVPITIIQNKNKICDIVINNLVSYDYNISKFKLDVNFTNNKLETKTINLLDINGISDFDKYDVLIDANSTSTYSRLFNTNSEFIEINYICNTNYESMKINLPEIEKEDQETILKKLTGYVNLINFENILDSLGFQIFLIVVLIGLVLSFSTRYIKYIMNK